MKYLVKILVLVIIEQVLDTSGQCPVPKLTNGRIRGKNRGKMVRFNCAKEFQLVGVKYAVCISGEWDQETPICVKPGCPNPRFNNGQLLESYRGAVIKVLCNPGYNLLGTPTVYCNGKVWNQTFPTCQVLNKNPAKSCDFESPDLCGWTQDIGHDVDWKISNSGAQNGSKEFYKTTENKLGRNLYIKTSNTRSVSERARLYSPVFTANVSNSCFIFWYYMHGSVTASLIAYVKPEGRELSETFPSFWITGQQGDFWKKGQFIIDTMDKPFQIVVEGVRGTGYEGKIQFDDVNITTIDQCTSNEVTSVASVEISTVVNDDDDAVFDDVLSCNKRCGQEPLIGQTELTGQDVGVNDTCDCHVTCSSRNTCCSDFNQYCTVGNETKVESITTQRIPTTTTTTTTTSSTTMSTSTTARTTKVTTTVTMPTPTTLRTTTKSPTTKPTSTVTSSKPLPSTNKTSITTAMSTPTTTAITSPTTTRRSSQKMVITTKSTPMTSTSSTTPTIQTKPTTTTVKTTPRTSLNNESNVVKQKTVDDVKTPVEPNNRTVKSDLPLVVNPSPSILNSKPKFEDRSKNKINSVKSNQEAIKSSDPPSTTSSTTSSWFNNHMFVIISVCTGVVGCLIVCLLVQRRRYQRIRTNDAEDSDVRQLTSIACDEYLDFTLAAPNNDEL